MGITGYLCAELLTGIPDGSFVEIKTTCDTISGQ